MNYYAQQGDSYFAQRSRARSEHVQTLRATLFSDLSCGTLLDFGCGTGGILSRLPAARKIGVEIGLQATEIARSCGIEVFPSTSDVTAESVDVAISFHALEHVDDDVACLLELHRVVKSGGRVRLIVPGELPLGNQRAWRENPDKHLRTWTPLSFGNLAERAGFTNIRTRIEPPVSGSTGTRILGKTYRWWLGVRDNSFNVILDAEK